MKTNFDIVLSDLEIIKSKVTLSEFANKKILVTGSNGLIGNYLLNFFAINSAKYKIEVYATSYSQELNKEKYNLDIINHFQYFSWDASTCFPESQIRNYDFVFFCSGYAQPSKFMSNPTKTILINTSGLASLLEKLNSDCTFVNMSSSEVYGNPTIIPTPETYTGSTEINHPRASYIFSKILSEIICNSYAKKMKIRNCRISLTYGPGTDFNDERVLQQLIKKASVEKNIKLLDDGSALRTYCYITDTIEKIINVCLYGKEDVYNVANPNGTISIYDLAILIANKLGGKVSKTEKSINNLSISAPKAVIMDINRYLKEFNKSEFIKIENGVDNILKYFNLI